MDSHRLTDGEVLVDQVKGRRHAVPESEANDLNRLLDVLRCATFETMQLRFEADCTVLQVKRGE